VLVEKYNSTVDLTVIVVKDLHTSFHWNHQLAKELSGVS
jgi:hypothetical protein